MKLEEGFVLRTAADDEWSVRKYLLEQKIEAWQGVAEVVGESCRGRGAPMREWLSHHMLKYGRGDLSGKNGMV